MFMKYVNGTNSFSVPPLPNDVDNPTYEEWMANDYIVQGWIKATMAN